MSAIYEVINDKVTIFLVFDKYDPPEKIIKIYNELNEEFPQRFILNMGTKGN